MELINNRHLFYGENTYQHAAGVLTGKMKKKAFLVVYNKESPFVRAVKNILSENGITCVIFDEIAVEPNLALVNRAVASCKASQCDCILAVGGGSVIDTAKLVAMIVPNGGDCEDYQLGRCRVEKEPLFFIAIPTTAGTGAEATKVAVVFNETRGWKKAVYDNSMIADTVILDPAAIVDLPIHIAVATGMDAIVHAIESCVSKGANAISRIYSLAALKLLYGNIVKLVSESDATVRTNMLLGSYLAGTALTVGAGIAHIVGQPLGALYHVPHGVSCSIFLLPAMKMNKEFAQDGFVEISQTLGVETKGKNYNLIFGEMLDRIEAMMALIKAPRRMFDYYPQDEFDIQEALGNIEESMSHIQSNPAPSNRESWQRMIELAANG